MRVAFATAEFIPLAKSGGLGDACAALARYLDRSGHDVRVFLPYYRQVRDAIGNTPACEIELADQSLKLGENTYRFNVLRYRLPDSTIELRLIDCPALFDREWLYTPDDDEHIRFGMFGAAALVYCEQTSWAPDILHCHDWHAALMPAQLAANHAGSATFADTRTLITIHNIGFQGVFGARVIGELGLAPVAARLDQDDLHKDRFNFLKTALLFADGVSTVSPTYAREITTPEFGHGLEYILAESSQPLTGILNGIDMALWNPAFDANLRKQYTMLDPAGKAENKGELIERFGLLPGKQPLVGMVSRLTGQKGVDLVVEALTGFLERKEMLLVVLGSGEERFEVALEALEKRFPQHMHFEKGYNEVLAHQIFAASDMTLVPSVFEPCGLTQMYGLRYGSIPVVRQTGGLADTVPPYDPASGAGLGFVFGPATTEALAAALQNALAVYRDDARWHALVRNAMAQDFSWDRPGAAYVALYERLMQA